MKVIGHRGARALAPENTIAGLKTALEYKVDAVEIDVRITKDKVAVLAHNDSALDADGNKMLIKAHTYVELMAHRTDTPTLAEAIRFIDRRVLMVIEIKPNEPTEQVVEVVRSFISEGWESDDLAFVSFDFKVLKQLRAAFPHHVLIVDEMWSGIRAMSRAWRLGSKDISLYTPIIWTGFVRMATSLGYRLYSFPQNDADQALRWQKAGYYGAITDRPDLFGK